MFTGIITALGRIRSIDPIRPAAGGAPGDDMRLVIDVPASFLAEPKVALGASIETVNAV